MTDETSTKGADPTRGAPSDTHTHAQQVRSVSNLMYSVQVPVDFFGVQYYTDSVHGLMTISKIGSDTIIVHQARRPAY